MRILDCVYIVFWLVYCYRLLFLSFAILGFIYAAGSYIMTRDFPKGQSDGGAMVYFLI
ncbi:hypothetical protein S40288_11789 [Stachybotrys chartarum IBT 40288]|nr:hypothetical protein S40288_11789 [Stachybotrys chartarum IBT 40288]